MYNNKNDKKHTILMVNNKVKLSKPSLLRNLFTESICVAAKSKISCCGIPTIM